MESSEQETDSATASLAHLLTAREWFITTVESCTGGGLAHVLTDLPGSSRWFAYGFTTYSNAAKTKLVNVDESLLHRYGAVSEQVAEAMCRGGAEVANAQCAIAITGIAGPDGGSREKPVGTVCFGWKLAEQVKTGTIFLSGDRAAIRSQSIHHAIREMCTLIKVP